MCIRDRFIPDTIEKGALCVISHEDLGDTDFSYILVESTGQALLDIAKLYRDSFDVKVVGITGSVGKTSTKEMIASVVAQKYKVHKTIGNFNNEWGLPLTIFEMNEEHQVEMCIRDSLYEDMSLSYVAEHSGFSSEVAFYRIFKKYTGTTPLEYRKQMLESGEKVYRGMIMSQMLMDVQMCIRDSLQEYRSSSL